MYGLSIVSGIAQKVVDARTRAIWRGRSTGCANINVSMTRDHKDIREIHAHGGEAM
jgi:hypothetical protein